MNEIKMPAAFAEIDENEMVYLNGGSITDTQGWLIFMNVGAPVQLRRPRFLRWQLHHQQRQGHRHHH